MAGTAQRLNLNSPFPGSGLSGFEEDDDLSSVGGGVWVESDSGNDENSISKGKGRMFTGYDSKGVDYSRLGGSQSGNVDPFYASPPSGNGSAAAAAAAATAELPNMTTGMTLPPPPLPKKKDSKFAKVPVSPTRRRITDIKRKNTYLHVFRAAVSRKPTPHRCVFRKLLARLSHLTTKTTKITSRVSSSILSQLSTLEEGILDMPKEEPDK